MIIKKTKIYRLQYQVDLDCNTGAKFVMSPQTPKDPHSGDDVPYFEFTGGELEEAILTMGLLPDEAKDPKCRMKRSEELSFKVAMVGSVLCELKDKNDINFLAMDENRLSFMDGSEKAAISYWLGMFFATLIAKKKFGYEYVTHYARFMKSKYKLCDPTKSTYTDPKTKKTVKLSTPDLIAMDATDPRKSNYGVFEAKGYQYFGTKTMQKAIEQVQQIKSINYKSNIQKIVAYTRLLPSGNTIRTKDPEGGVFDLELDNRLAILWQYLPVVDLFKEFENRKKFKSSDGFYVLNHSFVEGSERLKISKDLFDVLDKHRSDLREIDPESNEKLDRVINDNLLKVIIE